eukprot:COSAG01_NODE_341_length_18611_cov_31.251513_16_plen_277_part_00
MTSVVQLEPATTDSGGGDEPTANGKVGEERDGETVQLIPAEANAAPADPPGVVTAEPRPQAPSAVPLMGVSQPGAAMLSSKVAYVVERKKQQELKLKEMFQVLDADGSGTLDKGEVKKMAKLMGDNLRPEALRSAFEQMDKLNQGEVTFEQFKKWWFMKKEDERKAARKKAREVFDQIDADHVRHHVHAGVGIHCRRRRRGAAATATHVAALAPCSRGACLPSPPCRSACQQSPVITATPCCWKSQRPAGLATAATLPARPPARTHAHTRAQASAH